MALDGIGTRPHNALPCARSLLHIARHDDVISHDQLTAIATAVRVATRAQTLARGVYTSIYLGSLYGFIVLSDGRAVYGVHVPEGVHQRVILARLYHRLETEDVPQLRLMA
jgi:hypothetical protein